MQKYMDGLKECGSQNSWAPQNIGIRQIREITYLCELRNVLPMSVDTVGIQVLQTGLATGATSAQSNKINNNENQ